MGTLLRSELEEEVGAFFANRTDVSQTRYLRWLNLAQTRIARLNNWEELENITTDTLSYTGNADNDKFYTLPTNTKEIMNVRLIDGDNSRKLNGYIYREFDKAIPYPQRYSTGRPSIYTRWQGRLEFWKIPDSAYSIELRTILWPTAFTSSSDVVSDLDEKDDAIIMLAVSWGHLSLRNNDDASKYWRVYSRMINEIIGEDRERPDIDLVGFREGGDDLRSGTPWADPFVQSYGDGI